MGVEGIGASVVRKEDRRFTTGKGRYVGDIPGAQANVREDVIDVLDRLLHLWEAAKSGLL